MSHSVTISLGYGSVELASVKDSADLADFKYLTISWRSSKFGPAILGDDAVEIIMREGPVLVVTFETSNVSIWELVGADMEE
jgi:hypothetical protein